MQVTRRRVGSVGRDATAARRELQGADTLDGDLAALALRLRQRRKSGVQRERIAVVRTLEADEKLMPPRGRIGERQQHAAIPPVARCERASRYRGQFVSRR